MGARRAAAEAPVTKPSKPKGFLFDIRVLEVADHRGEFLGKLLAGAGADVVKVEPPAGAATREIGPFYEDSGDPEQSLHFWHYNVGKRAVTLDLEQEEGRRIFKQLAADVDVIVETHPPGYLASLGLGYDDLKAENPRLVYASITDFGQDGPRRDWQGSDLVHLALGGVMMNCGYDSRPDGAYDTPPIAPQMWHASHITCNQTYIAILGALMYRERSGTGQHIDSSIHHAVNVSTEMDIPFFVYNRMPLRRQTGRHASTSKSTNSQALTKDGRYVNASLGIGVGAKAQVDMLREHGVADDLADPKYDDPEALRDPAVMRHVNDLIKRWIGTHKFDEDLWKVGQSYKLHWVPIRRPEENLEDEHWRTRKTFAEVEHEDLERSFTYNGAPWMAEHCPWTVGPRAPHLGEHNGEVLAGLGLDTAEIEALRAKGVV